MYAVSRGKTLGAALEQFRELFGADPVAVIVNAGLVDETAAAVIGGGLGIPVMSSGGALLGELWLQRPAVDVKAAAETIRSLTARVSAAHRAVDPMTPERARQMVLALEVEVER